MRFHASVAHSMQMQERMSSMHRQVQRVQGGYRPGFYTVLRTRQTPFNALVGILYPLRDVCAKLLR
jgi:hypothetical protein